MTLALLAGVVLLAFLMESVVGFGATVLTVTLGTQLYPLDVLLPAFVPLNLALSATLVARHHRDVDRKLLFRRILPWMGLGVAAGLMVSQMKDLRLVLACFGFIVVVLAARELYVLGRAVAAPVRFLPGPVVAGGLSVAGVIHGIFGSGGPLVVYLIGREVQEKARFRVTLSALWLILNCVLLLNFARLGWLTRQTGTISLVLVPVLVGSLWIGERVFARLPARPFRWLMWIILLFAGASLGWRHL